LPVFHGAAAQTTLRELLAQISGEGDLRGLVDIRQDPRISLAQSAAEIAERPLAHPPGQVFDYGGPGFQVVGALAEAVTDQRWADLFDARIARPLGMIHTEWVHLPDRGVPASQTRNPLLQGGVVTTADDYMRFLAMIAHGGTVGGRRILSSEAVATMETIQTRDAATGYLPPGARGAMAQYALGNWCERWTETGDCTLVSSPGAFGTFPWIDRVHGTYGLFFVRARSAALGTTLLQARAAILADR
jgi:CubicO group peptidase (beta-lactamase class C family)